LPRKPPVGGRPAKLSMKVHMDAPSSGRSQPMPARSSTVTSWPSSRSRAAITAKAPIDAAA
jgi:hypothetical protein